MTSLKQGMRKRLFSGNVTKVFERKPEDDDDPDVYDTPPPTRSRNECFYLLCFLPPAGRVHVDFRAGGCSAGW